MEGKYAWENQDALMIGYVKDNSTIEGELKPDLNDNHDSDIICGPEKILNLSTDAAVSKHERNFEYIHVSPPDNKPGSN